MALGTILPIWPALLFTYIEPVALLSGWNIATFSPAEFATKQVPTLTSTYTPQTAAVDCLSYSLGNIFVLLALLAVLCTAITRDSRVAKYYLLFVAIGDVGHILASYRAMGPTLFWDIGGYNDMQWGNIGFSAFLFVNRIATASGLFGRIGLSA